MQELSEYAKHPIVLPTRHPLTRLVVLDGHCNNEHVGVQHTLLYTKKRYWIVKGTWSVKKYLKDCMRCAIEHARPIRQLMADLPIDRVSSCSKAFEVSGMDYFGPLSFVENRSVRKAWGLLFTCLCTRAVHVELVTSLSLSDFILDYSRFLDVRGNVRKLYSDNGSTFVAAEKKIPELLNSVELGCALRERGTVFEKIPVYCPAQGVWESLVKEVNFC